MTNEAKVYADTLNLLGTGPVLDDALQEAIDREHEAADPAFHAPPRQLAPAIPAMN